MFISRFDGSHAFMPSKNVKNLLDQEHVCMNPIRNIYFLLQLQMVQGTVL